MADDEPHVPSVPLTVINKSVPPGNSPGVVPHGFVADCVSRYQIYWLNVVTYDY